MKRTVQNLREDQKDNEDLLRAMNALDHAEIIPIETEAERSYRKRLLAERKRIGVPRTHRAACKAIGSENRFTMHYYKSRLKRRRNKFSFFQLIYKAQVFQTPLILQFSKLVHLHYC